MDEIVLLPRPRVLVPQQGSGPRVSAPAGEAGIDIARCLAADPPGEARRMGIPLETCGVEDYERRTGLRSPAGFTPAEGYAMRVGPAGVLVGADTPAARVNALRTLAQLAAGGAGNAGSPGGTLPALHAWDWPRLALRGFSLCYHLVDETMPLLAPNYEAARETIAWFGHLKMNAVFIEWEAMYPYRRHPSIASRQAFTAEQVRGIRDAADDARVEVIPLVQSIGHAYAVLRHERYAHLRELPDTSQQFCLCNAEVPGFFNELADELIDALGCRRLHVGGDESRRLGQCPRCQEKASRVGIGGLYADHVNAVAAHLLSRGVTPVVWGDIMEDHPDILERIDPRIEIIYWNYDPVDWNRPYVAEAYPRPGRTVYAGSGARFGPHGDATFLYKKSMRTMGLMAQEAERLGMAGLVVTDWTKLAPYEVGIVATSYGAEAAWSGAGPQEEFVGRWAAHLYGASMPGLDRFYRLVSEAVLRRRDTMNPHWAPPFVDQVPHYMPDWLDRMDMSMWSFGQVLAQYSQQELIGKATAEMRAGLARAEEALAIVDAQAPRVTRNRRLFDAARLAAVNQRAKCAMGLALTRAGQLLKFPRPADGEARRAAADDLRAALAGWRALRDETRRVLLPGTFPGSLERALRFKLDPDAEASMERFIALLEDGSAVHGLLDGSTWDQR